MSTREGKYLLFPLLGILDICTNLLDKFVFISNLELLLFNNFLSIGLYFIFFNLIKNINISRKLLVSFYCILLIYAGILFSFDCPSSTSELYSKYGYLNYYEYSLFCLLSSFICITFCTLTLVKLFQNQKVTFNIIFIIFGIIIYYIGDIIKFGLGIQFLQDSQAHKEFMIAFLPIKLYTSRVFILLGLIWKN